MPESCVRVARGLLLHGAHVRDRLPFLELVDVKNNAFRSGGSAIGATGEPGLRFFDSTTRNELRFGPGAGLVLGVSVGTASLRAALVDANGILHHGYRADPHPGQLTLTADDLLDRIKNAATEVLRPALLDDDLLVEGALPFLGISVAWAVPVSRDNTPLGPALQHRSWRFGPPLKQQVAQHLNIAAERSHGMNDAHAGAIAVAWHQTRADAHRSQTHARMAIVMRLAGGISGASIVVEPPDRGHNLGATSGFLRSILIGGVDMHAGELGHVPLDASVIAARNEDLPTGLGPLTAHSCSCSDSTEDVPPHLEAYAATPSFASRIASDERECDVVRRAVATPDEPVHQRALHDVGALVGYALLGPVAMLNPATITLTGSLAVPVVRTALSDSLRQAQPFGSLPDVRLLEGDVNQFVRAQGAALAVLREQVYRQLDGLVGESRKHVPPSVRRLTSPLTRVPWDD